MLRFCLGCWPNGWPEWVLLEAEITGEVTQTPSGYSALSRALRVINKRASLLSWKFKKKIFIKV